MIKIKVRKKDFLAILFLLMIFTGTSTININDIVNAYGDVFIQENTTVGEGQGKIEVGVEGENLSIVPDGVADNKLFYNTSDGSWETREMEVQRLETENAEIDDKEIATEKFVDENTGEIKVWNVSYSETGYAFPWETYKTLDVDDAVILSARVSGSGSPVYEHDQHTRLSWAGGSVTCGWRDTVQDSCSRQVNAAGGNIYTIRAQYHHDNYGSHSWEVVYYTE